MACSFSANQFEHEFKARQLCNWEVPKYHPARPEQRKNITKVISNDRGHLLPCVKKPDASPWGNFKGTWQLPDKIPRELANLVSAPQVGASRWTKNHKRSPHRAVNNKTEAAQTSICCPNRDLAYIPGDITQPHEQHPSREQLLKERKKSAEPTKNPLYTEKHACTDHLALLKENETKRRETCGHVLEDILNLSEPLPQIEPKFESVVDEDMKENRAICEKPNEVQSPLPLIPAFCNFRAAKKMAQENLEHQPLPDAIMDLAFRRLQAQGADNPGLALDVIPMATGIGYKNYKAGPTQCTKLRVYRPQTCGVVPNNINRNNFQHRPHTSIQLKDKMGPMDMAICWDFRPIDPRDEPKKTKHIDGSNGCLAPAIFTLVKTPTPEDDDKAGNTDGVFSNTIGDYNFFDRDVIRQHKEHQKQYETERKCTCGTSVASWNSTRQLNVERPQTSGVKLLKPPDVALKIQRSKSSPNIARTSDSCSSNRATASVHSYPEKEGHKHHHHHHHHHNHHHSKQQDKQKRMCQQQNQSYLKEPQRAVYKVAFKAGIPNGNSSGTCTSFDSGCSSMSMGGPTTNPCKVKVVRVPRPREPFAKKNYTIATLHPPFASWRGGAGQGGYPDHWRLASVYQHAYKPVELRKRPLLQTVFQ